MTIATTLNRVSYAGDGTTNPWSLAGLYFLANADLKVIRRNADGSETPLVYATDYTVSGAGNPAGGSVTPLAATVAGASYVIVRDPPATQSFTLTDGAALPAASAVQTFDRLTMLIQRLSEQVARGVTLKETDTKGAGRLDAGANRLVNLTDPVDPGDAVTSGYLTATYSGPIAAAAATATSAASTASTAASAAAASYDSFDDRYLGAKAVNPTVDNDGDPLLTGALYFNSAVGEMRIWSGSAWVAAYVGSAGLLPLTGGTMTGSLTLAADPAASLQAATKSYVDNVAAGLDIKSSAKAASTANLTLSGAQTVDTVSLVAGDRCLVKNQTTTSQNGIYVVASGSWARSADMNSWANVPGASLWVEQGSQADTAWVCISDQGGTLGTTAINWTQFGGTGAFQAANGNLSALAALTSAAGKLPYFSGSNAALTTDFLTTGIALAGAANAAAARSTIAAEQIGVMAGVNAQTANYTVVLSDAGKTVEMNAAANTLTIPPNSSVAFPVGTYINIVQTGGGITTITPGAGVTLQNRNGLRTAGQWALATIYKTATDTWVVGGDVQV